VRLRRIAGESTCRALHATGSRTVGRLMASTIRPLCLLPLLVLLSNRQHLDHAARRLLRACRR
jgi:hypothetical protein